MRKWFCILLLAFVGLLSCSSDPYSKFLGQWGADNPREFFEIRRDGEAVLIEQIDLASGGFFGSPKVLPLVKREGQLSIQGALGSAALAISEDALTLYMFGRQYRKLSDTEAAAVRQEAFDARARMEAQKAGCEKLQAEHQRERVVLDIEELDFAEKRSKGSEIDRLYRKKADELGGRCWIPLSF